MQNNTTRIDFLEMVWGPLEPLKVFVFVIVLWMGKRGMEKDWVGARMKDVGVGWTKVGVE
jgi:hypothetical protein